MVSLSKNFCINKVTIIVIKRHLTVLHNENRKIQIYFFFNFYYNKLFKLNYKLNKVQWF